MTDKENGELPKDTDEKTTIEETTPESAQCDELQKSLDEANEKYIRLYADFDNYKRIAARNKEELLKYANEELMSDVLTVIDHLELALQHSAGTESSSSLAEGVELTLKELKNVLEKHGLVNIEAIGKEFDPAVHHAMSQIESEDAEENTVMKEFRKGYMLRERVLRAALVGVAIKQSQPESSDTASSQDQTATTEEE